MPSRASARISWRCSDRASAVTPVVEGEDYDLALVLLGRHRGENEARLAEALARVEAGRAGRGRRRARRKAPTACASGSRRLLPLAGSASKYHGVVFWLEATGRMRGRSRRCSPRRRSALVEGRFRTAPGMFSHGRVDPGSRLLAEQSAARHRRARRRFRRRLGLSRPARLADAPGVAALDLYEADFASLEAARDNLAATGRPAEADFFWLDLTAEKVDAPL